MDELSSLLPDTTRLLGHLRNSATELHKPSVLPPRRRHHQHPHRLPRGPPPDSRSLVPTTSVSSGYTYYFLFGCGFVSCCAGCVSTYYTYRVSMEYDQVWASYLVWLASGIELYVGIVSLASSLFLYHPQHLHVQNRKTGLTKQICASITSTKPFFNAYISSLFGTLTTTIRTSTNPSLHQSSAPRNPRVAAAPQLLYPRHPRPSHG